MRRHSVQYRITRLREAGVFQHHPFIDIHRMGLRWCAVFCSLQAYPTQERAFRRFASQHPRVGWFAELIGNFSYGLAVAVEDPCEIDTFLKDATEKSAACLSKKSIAFRTTLVDTPRRYLSTRITPAPALSMQDGVAQVPLDHTDRRILAALTQQPSASTRDLGAALGVPHTTVDLRLKKLRGAAVLLGESMELDLPLLGRELHKVLVFTTGKSRELSKRMAQFALEHPDVSHFIESVGAWDFEFNIEVPSPRQVQPFCTLLRTKFAPHIHDTVTLAIAEVMVLRRGVGVADPT
jgi:DNA-binding Lrp family transcriptional regulator